MRRSVWLPGFVGLLVMAGAAFGQQASPAAFVLTENGLNTTALAALTIGGNGSVVGTEVVQSGGAAVTYAVQGVMSANDDGTKSLVLNRTSSDALDADGNPLISTESLKLVVSPAGGYLAFRTDPGQAATGDLMPSVSAPAPGAYLLSGKAGDPALSVDLVTLDAAGALSGRRMDISSGPVSVEPFAGSYQMVGNGFYTIQMVKTSTDSDGNQSTSTESYFALATSKDVRLVRAYGASGLLTLQK